MSTRTAVKFGSILSNLIRDRMPYFEEAFTEVSSQYLLYAYKKPISTAYHGYILVQASRTQGRFGVEVAITRGESYPYHRANDFPEVGVSGFRESVFTLLKGYNHSEEYANAESLFRALYSLLKDAEMALSRLNERFIGKIQTDHDRWQNLYNQWLVLEQDATGSPGYRYPVLTAESLAFEIIEDILTRNTFDRYLGPLKYRYRNPHFMNCHVYMLARGLEFLETPEPPLHQVHHEVPGNKKHLIPLDDPISALTGRWPQIDSVTLSPSTATKTTQFAFLKSLSAVEALLKLDAAGNPIRTDGFSFFGETQGESLIDAPDYADPTFSSYAAPPKPAASPAPKPVDKTPEAEQPMQPSLPKKPIFSVDDGDDPIAMLENRFGLR